MPRSLTRIAGTRAAAAMRARMSAPARMTSARAGRGRRCARARPASRRGGARSRRRARRRRGRSRARARGRRSRGRSAIAASEVTVPAMPTRVAPRRRPGDDRERAVDLARDGGELGRLGRIVAHVLLGEAHGAERQAPAPRHGAALGDDDLRRAAADVDDDQRARRASSGNDAAAARKVSAASRAPSMTSTGTPRISAAGPRKSSPLGARRSASVPMAAMRAPCWRASARVAAQHVERARDALGAQRAAGADAAAEARDLGALVEHRDGARGLGARDEQQRRVRADVDRREGAVTRRLSAAAPGPTTGTSRCRARSAPRGASRGSAPRGRRGSRRTR